MFRVFIIFLLLALPTLACADSTPDLQKALTDSAFLPDLDANIRVELDGFYAQRGYRPAWNLSDDDEIKKTTAFLDSIEALVTYHGLIKSSFHIPEMRKLAGSLKSGADRQKLEVMITESLLRLAHALHGDDVNLDQLYTGWNFHRQPADLPAQLAMALNDNKLEAFYDRLSPQNPAYRELARILQDYRAIETHGNWPHIDSGPPLLPGDYGPRVTQLRARLAAEGYLGLQVMQPPTPAPALTDLPINAPDVMAPPAPSNDGDALDAIIDKALILYQTRNGLSPDGHAGGKTLEALNMPLAARIAQIRANMERWRHMPEDFPTDRYTLINIPDFSVTIVDNGAMVYRGIVIDGKPDRQTPFIDSKIVNMVVDPPWNVPAKIARKDILPKLRKDRHYLEKLGFVIAGRTEDPTGASIDWKDMDDADFNYQLRQSPGDLNSLGKLKFNFANPFDVYMHGTPHQELFAKAERDFSSGCVRLEDPVRVGEILLGYNKDKGGWTEDRINSEIDAGKTHWVILAKPMPIYFLYWSVFTTEDGEANFRNDIYGYDSQLMEEMKNNAVFGP